MEKIEIEDKTFTSCDFKKKALEKGEYENCSFINCILSDCSLTDVTFSDCTFEGCDLSMAKLGNTSFKGVNFKNCKLLGLRFDDCNKFLMSFDFEACNLSLCSFFSLKLKGTSFKDCKLEEVEFSDSDFTNAKFINCDLDRALFQNTILEGADLRTAFNFSIDPEMNRIGKARFSTEGLVGLLSKYDLKIG